MKRILLLILTSLSVFTAFAQTETVEMADAMRSDGKIYVVISVILVLFAVLFAYLISIDRKVSKLEKELKK